MPQFYETILHLFYVSMLPSHFVVLIIEILVKLFHFPKWSYWNNSKWNHWKNFCLSKSFFWNCYITFLKYNKNFLFLLITIEPKIKLIKKEECLNIQIIHRLCWCKCNKQNYCPINFTNFILKKYFHQSIWIKKGTRNLSHNQLTLILSANANDSYFPKYLFIRNQFILKSNSIWKKILFQKKLFYKLNME